MDLDPPETEHEEEEDDDDDARPEFRKEDYMSAVAPSLVDRNVQDTITTADLMAELRQAPPLHVTVDRVLCHGLSVVSPYLTILPAAGAREQQIQDACGGGCAR